MMYRIVISHALGCMASIAHNPRAQAPSGLVQYMPYILRARDIIINTTTFICVYIYGLRSHQKQSQR